MASIPVGGQQVPNSIVGERLLWKKAQKKAKKNKTSEVMKRIIPHRRPAPTWEVCWPSYVDSRTTSRHHWNIVRITIRMPNITREGLLK